MLYNGKIIYTPQYIFELARQLRQDLTESEKMLWEKLRNKQLGGYRFRCQHPVYRYILDFYCHETILAVEIDGNVHKERKAYDKYRDDLLKSIGIITLRVTTEEVLSDIELVLNNILSMLEPR